jgi:transposase
MATVAQDNEHSSLAVTRAATSRSVAGRLESSSRASQRSRQETANLPPVVDTTDTPACSEAQDARRLGAQGRLAMRSIGLDLGVRHIAFCEVKDGKVVDRGAVRSFSQLESRLGPKTAKAVVGFEACREGWHVHDTLLQWGHRPRMLDTTRVRQIGVGQHKRKNDAIDAETIAQAIESGRVAEAHVLSPERRALRAQLSVRGALIQTRSQYVTTIRGLARAVGILLPSSATGSFLQKLTEAKITEELHALLAPLTRILEGLDREIAEVDQTLSKLAERDPTIQLCATAPGVGLIVAATYVSVIDQAKRFRNAHAVAAYLGLVPGEATTGGPSKRRLGGITKQGNTYARTLLIQSAWSILRLRHCEDPLRKWADHIAETRGKKIAVVALARKLAGVLWAMLRDGTPYDGAVEAEQSALGVREQAVKTAKRARSLEVAAKKLRRSAPKADTKAVRPPAKAGRTERRRKTA